MGDKNYWSVGYNHDPDYMNKDGKQIKAIMRMIDRLKEPKEADFDITNAPNHFDIDTYVNNEEPLDAGFTFGDKLGLLLSQNVRGWYSQIIFT
jgi:hypothetical protein